MRFSCFLIILLGGVLRAQDDPRRTPTVGLLQRCLPATVALKTFSPHEKPGLDTINLGGGSIVHEAGYILTNDHVLRNIIRGEAMLHTGKVLPYEVIARLPQEDLALVRVRGPQPFPTIVLGRSHDLMLGEPTIAIGSPGGMPHSVSTGIISGLRRSTNTEHAFLPHMVQTSAATSGGSSGGPLLNAWGEQIGVISSKRQDLENVNFAIVSDRIRIVFPHMLNLEQRRGLRFGIEFEMLAENAKIHRVAANSAAHAAGVRPGDVLSFINGRPVRQGLDAYLSLLEHPAGSELNVQRQDGATLRWTPSPLPIPPAGVLENPQAGLLCETYSGRWKKTPRRKPDKSSQADRLQIGDEQADGKEYGVRFHGWIRLPQDGFYRFYLRCDDGGQLKIADRLTLLAENRPGLREFSGTIRLSAGWRPLELICQQFEGDSTLQVLVQPPQGKKQEIPPEWLFHQARPPQKE